MSAPLKAAQPAVAVVCPALNEVATIGAVVAGIARVGVSQIIVVDNGSTDGTAAEAEKAGARVVSAPVRGYGAACLAGAQAASARILVYMDADGSFSADEIGRLIEPLVQGRAELVLGSRTQSGSTATLAHQRFGNWLMTRLLRLLYGMRVTDLGPFRAIGRETLLDLGMSEMTYGWPVEMMILARTAGLRVLEVPVSYRPRQGGRSKVSGSFTGSISAAYRITRTVVGCAWRSRARNRAQPSGARHE